MAATDTASLAKPRLQIPQTPRKMHHLGYVVHDADATLKFYSDVLGLELVRTVIDDRVPSTGDPFPYIHLFFKLHDGSQLAFFESLDLPAPATASHPAYDIFNHLALDVGTAEEVDRWAKHLRASGIEVVGPHDHGSIYSLYFFDPSGIRLEFTCSLAWKEDPEKAKQDVAGWTAQKKKSLAAGTSAPLAEWIEKNRKTKR